MLVDPGSLVSCSVPEDIVDLDGAFSRCVVECTGSACEDVYIEHDAPLGEYVGYWSLNDTKWADVAFRCSSEDVNGVAAVVAMAGSETTFSEGSCSGHVGKGTGKNLLLAQLGMLCSFEGQEYVYDDAYFECFDGAVPATMNGHYTCVTGAICPPDDAACRIAYQTIAIQADAHRFRHCISANDGSIVPEPEVPAGETLPLGRYSAEFRVSSAFEYNQEVCSGGSTAIQIVCIDGLVELIASDPDKDCQVVGESEIECTELETSAINAFVDVATYSCTSEHKVPQTRVEYAATHIACDSVETEVGWRWLNVGIRCDGSEGAWYASVDSFFECGPDNDAHLATEEFRFSCVSFTEVPADSKSTTFPISPVEVSTDFRWAIGSSDLCYSHQPDSEGSNSSFVSTLSEIMNILGGIRAGF